ncbi:WD40 repeat-like protein [Thelephora ganbajun]|uniref:WD40 repeat-like protein n=1 Tax=Thelephora ganbajun TaxID=370292 RepID=A0ACB6ZH70_THEGA|nr:WD40 repeat-like protein [Thelephora ganbajun]
MAGVFGGLVNPSAQPTLTDMPDVDLVSPPPESISTIAFSPVADHLAVGSWGPDVRIYDVGPQGQSQGKALAPHPGTVLDLCWTKDGTKLVSVGTDNAARMFDLLSGTSTQVGQHDGPIKCVRWFEMPQGRILATGSWDKMLKYWDLRSPNPLAVVELKERCYTMDVKNQVLAVGTADRHIQIFHLSNPITPYKTVPSPLKWQTRTIALFPNADGYALGSIEGRVAIQKNYSFRCHRKDQTPGGKDQTLVFSVNDIKFHPVHGTLATCGSDGTVSIWDKDARTRMKTFNAVPSPIVSASFNHTGTIFAYAAAYDWSRGHAGNVPSQWNKVLLHGCKEDEVRKRPPKPAMGHK